MFNDKCLNVNSKYLYFFDAFHKNNPPPIPITAIPINGDQLMLCGFSRVISMDPKSTTFSLLKNCKVVKIVNPSPITKIIKPAVLMVVVFILIPFYLIIMNLF